VRDKRRGGVSPDSQREAMPFRTPPPWAFHDTSEAFGAILHRRKRGHIDSLHVHLFYISRPAAWCFAAGRPKGPIPNVYLLFLHSTQARLGAP